MQLENMALAKLAGIAEDGLKQESIKLRLG